MGTSKQTGVEFQQCGKQQTLHWVREETSAARVPVAAGLFPPPSDGGTAGGLTPTEKPGWNKNPNKHSRPPLAFGAAGLEFWTTSRTRVDKNFRGLPLSRWQPWRILLVFGKEHWRWSSRCAAC